MALADGCRHRRATKANTGRQRTNLGMYHFKKSFMRDSRQERIVRCGKSPRHSGYEKRTTMFALWNARKAGVEKCPPAKRASRSLRDLTQSET
jgi:hypothetical protein